MASLPPSPPLVLFVSHAAVDNAAFGELKKHLAPHVNKGRLKIVSSHDLPIGDVAVTRDQAARIAIAAADAAALLVTADYIASDIYTFEVGAILAQLESATKQGAKPFFVFPVLVKGSTWQDEKWAKLKILPDPETTVDHFTKRDDAWTAIVKHIALTLKLPTGFLYDKRALYALLGAGVAILLAGSLAGYLFWWRSTLQVQGPEVRQGDPAQCWPPGSPPPPSLKLTHFKWSFSAGRSEIETSRYIKVPNVGQRFVWDESQLHAKVGNVIVASAHFKPNPAAPNNERGDVVQIDLHITLKPHEKVEYEVSLCHINSVKENPPELEEHR